MWLKKLYLHHFRNYTQAEIAFSPSVNWITGKNAQGKTNLLEAIYLLSCGRSFRTHQLNQLIQKRSSFFYLEAEIEKEGVTQTLKLSFDGETKKIDYNATAYSHFSSLLGLLPHVLYAPEDSALISGAPSFRRRFLNLYLSQMDPLYLHHLARYHKAMRQRNELLKKKSQEAIEPWEQAMAHNAVYLMEKRNNMLEDLKKPLKTIMEELSDGEDLDILYKNSLPLEDASTLYQQFQSTRAKELFLGATLNGPHRDDIQFSINSLSAKGFASEGQKHCIIAALALCQWHHLHRQMHEAPLFSIDDFGAHLDTARQYNFQQNLSELGQTFITSPEQLPEIFPEKHVIHVSEVLKIGRT